MLKKFIEEEVGETAFRGLTFELLQAMGIKNKSNIGVLLNAQEQLKRGELTVAVNQKVSDTSPKRESTSNSLEVSRWLAILPIGTDVTKKGTVDKVASKRLETRLEQFKLKRRGGQEIEESGANSVFLAVADQLFDSPDSAGEIRSSLANWLKRNKDFKVEGNLSLHSLVHGCSWEKYCSQMEKDAWGDGLALIAISEVYGCKIFIVSSVIGSEYAITIMPSVQKNSKTVLLSHTLDLYFCGLDQIVEQPVLSTLDDFVIDFNHLKLLRYDHSSYDFFREIGSGSTGEIFECLWRGARVAAKKISLTSFSSEEITGFMNEIALLKRLRHPNILQVVNCQFGKWM